MEAEELVAICGATGMLLGEVSGFGFGGISGLLICDQSFRRGFGRILCGVLICVFFYVWED